MTRSARNPTSHADRFARVDRARLIAWVQRNASLGMLLIVAGLVGIVVTAEAARARPDLRASEVSAAPSSVRAGQALAVTVGTTNASAFVPSPPSTTRLYLGRTRARDGRVILLASVSTPALGPDEDAVKQATVAVPESTPLGRYYVLACSDATDQVAERNERNNCGASREAIEVVK